jgi:hypothetical protein
MFQVLLRTFASKLPALSDQCRRGALPLEIIVQHSAPQ